MAKTPIKSARKRCTLEDLARPHEPMVSKSIACSCCADGAHVPASTKAWIGQAVRAAGIEADARRDSAELDMVNHPPHYKRGGMECVDIVEAMATGWSPQTALRLSQAVQCIFRHAHKGEPALDLKRAVSWIQREIDSLEREEPQV